MIVKAHIFALNILIGSLYGKYQFNCIPEVLVVICLYCKILLLSNSKIVMLIYFYYYQIKNLLIKVFRQL